MDGAKEKYRPHRALTDSIAVRDNLVIILCESLESWVIDRKVDGVEITPVLDSLIADTASTLYAPNVLTQVAAGRSIDCQLLVNAGMLPMQSSVYSMRYPQNRYYTLNRALAEKKTEHAPTYSHAISLSYGIRNRLLGHSASTPSSHGHPGETTSS